MWVKKVNALPPSEQLRIHFIGSLLCTQKSFYQIQIWIELIGIPVELWMVTSRSSIQIIFMNHCTKQLSSSTLWGTHHHHHTRSKKIILQARCIASFSSDLAHCLQIAEFLAISEVLSLKVFYQSVTGPNPKLWLTFGKFFTARNIAD